MKNKDQKGFILIITIIFLATTTFSIWYYLNQASIHTYKAEFSLRKLQSHNMATSAFNLACLKIKNTSVLNMPYTEETSIGKNTSLSYTITCESSKININKLINNDGAVNKKLEKVFLNLLKKSHLPIPDKNILYDWIDSDDVSRPKGAENEYYLSYKQHHTANNKLTSLHELSLLKNNTLDIDIIDKTKQYLTLFSDGLININYADELLIAALSDNINISTAKQIVKERKRKPKRFTRLTELKKIPGISDSIFKEIKPLISIENNYFLIYALGNYKNIKTEITAVIFKKADKFKILTYREI